MTFRHLYQLTLPHMTTSASITVYVVTTCTYFNQWEGRPSM